MGEKTERGTDRASNGGDTDQERASTATRSPGTFYVACPTGIFVGTVGPREKEVAESTWEGQASSCSTNIREQQGSPPDQTCSSVTSCGTG